MCFKRAFMDSLMLFIPFCMKHLLLSSIICSTYNNISLLQTLSTFSCEPPEFNAQTFGHKYFGNDNILQYNAFIFITYLDWWLILSY